MGVVWIAEHAGLGTRVAVKFIAPERAEGDPSLVDRFRREASVAARLSSPHVVRIFDHGTMDDGTSYIVMELLRGRTLGELLRAEGRLGLPTVTAVVSQVAGALGAAHADGIVHRDVKPDNIFLLDSEYDVFVKLLDFGVAKDSRHTDGPGSLPEAGATAHTVTGALLGTPYYMAPEQLVDGHSDAGTDSWALAVVAYHALTGHRPFVGDSAAEIAQAIHARPPQLASEHVEGLPLAVDAWFARALSVTPADRFGSAIELSRALQAAAGAPGAAPLAHALGTSSAAPRPKTGRSAVDPSGAPPTEIAAPAAGAASRLRAPSRNAWLLVAAAAILAGWGVLTRGPSASGSDTTLRAPEPSASKGIEMAPPGAAHAASVADPSVPGASQSPTSTDPAVSPTGRGSRASTTASASVKSPPAAAASTAPTATTAASGEPRRPAYCDTDEAYVVNEQGHLRPRPECL